MQKICRDTIQGLTSDVNKEMIYSDSINSIIEIIVNKYPRRKDNIPTIFEFAQRLYDYDGEEKDKIFKDKIEQWLKKNKNFPINYSQRKEKLSSSENQSIAQYIAIVVEEFEPEPNLQFSLSVTRFYKDNYDEIDLPKETKISRFHESELRSKIISIINNLQEIIYEKHNCYIENTIIELFLPYNQIKNNYDLDFEKISEKGIKGSQLITIGEKFCFVIRCFERYAQEYNPYGYQQKLLDRWKILQNIIIAENYLEDKLNKRIDYLNSINPDKNTSSIKFWKKLLLDWNRNQKISINLTCSLLPKDGSKLDAFLENIIDGGIPLVLWNRNPNFSFDYVKVKFSNLVNKNYLKKLNNFYKKIHEVRQDAYIAEIPEKEIGYHLGVLFDHPYRIPCSINKNFLICSKK